MTAMTTILRDALSIGQRRDGEQVHFHIGGDGRPFVCDHTRCDSVGLTLAEADREHQPPMSSAQRPARRVSRRGRAGAVARLSRNRR
jgi:hypothetical protein